MRTDALFYELFQAAPQTFFELLQIEPECPYRFESITVKTTEKRIDGVLEPTETGHPIYFLEVQAFPDEAIYWRTMRETATYFEQRPELKDNEWQAVVLWLNKGDDPSFGTLELLARKPNPRLLSVDLMELLKKLDEGSLVLNVLRPLLVEDERQVRQNVVQWVENIRQASDSTQDLEEKLISVLSQLIEQKFRILSYEELSKMLRLTPWRETITGQSTIKEERVNMLTRHISRKFDLSEKSLFEIKLELEGVSSEYLEELVEDILDIHSLEVLERWIDEHTPEEQDPEHNADKDVATRSSDPSDVDGTEAAGENG